MISTPHESVSEPPQEAAPPKKKRVVTDAMRAANKANAAKSSGPVTPEGRAAVIVNAVSHGQTCKRLIFLDDEDPTLFWQDVARWAQHRGAVTPDEIAAIEAAVYSRWTKRRAQNADACAVKETIAGIKNGFDDRKAAEVEALKTQLATTPRVTVNELMSSSCGCTYLLEQFLMIWKWLATHPCLEASQRPYFLQLCGHRPEDLFINREVWDINRDYLGALKGVGGCTKEEAADAFVYDRPEEVDVLEFERRLGRMISTLPSKQVGLARLQKRVKKTIKRLRERLELVGFREDAAKEAAIGKAQADISADGDRRARYMNMSDRTLDSSLRTVMALKKDRRASGDELPELDYGPPEDDPPPETAPPLEPERTETPAASRPAESDQAHRNGASEPVAESPVPGSASDLHDRAQNKAVTTQVVDESGDNNPFTAPPAAESAHAVLLSEADHEARRAAYRRIITDVGEILKECSENDASGPPDS